MSRKMIRCFFGFVESQQKWLNIMAQKGYRLIASGKLVYEFEVCKPSEFQYYIDFVAEKSNTELNSYKAFLEELGYKVFFKNINLNWSLGNFFGKQNVILILLNKISILRSTPCGFLNDKRRLLC